MIGYAVSLTNRALGLELFGSPQEVLEQLQARGLLPEEVATHRETVLSYKKVFKAHPQMEFSGGPHAEAVLLLLDAIHRADPSAAASIVADDPALLTDAHDGAYIPLLAAVWAGRLEVVQLLLANDASVDGTTHFGMTPLHWAAAGGYSAIAVRLLEGGADAKRVSWFYALPQDLALLNARSETAQLISERSGIAPEMFSVERLLTRLGWRAVN
jgi:hypothetical protein